MEADILVVGAGAIGCYIGARIQQSTSLRLAFYARPNTKLRLARGLRVSDWQGYDQSLAGEQLRVIDDLDCIAQPRLIILAVKSPATTEVGQLIWSRFGREVPVWSLQNGVENVAQLEQVGLSVVPGMVAFNVAEVHANDKLAALHYHCGTSGELAYEAQHESALEPLFRQLKDSGLLLKRYENLRPVQWAKLLMNLNNPINALSGLPLLAQLLDRNYRRCVAILQEEAFVAMRAAGIVPANILPVPMRFLPTILRLPTWAYRRIARRMLTMDAHARSSMAEDFARNRQPEIDALCGAVLRLAHQHGVQAPANAWLVREILGGLRACKSEILLSHLMRSS